jgi:hypothetical protein
MEAVVKRLLNVGVSLLLAAAVSYAQDDLDEEMNASGKRYVQPPPDLRNWTPDARQFQLYINFDGSIVDTSPRIDILSENSSWPFMMKTIGDTLYIFIAPPRYVLKTRDTVGLSSEFPFVVWAGSQRATYWFSYDSGTVTLDTLVPAPFVVAVALKPLPDNVVTLQLKGAGKNAKILRQILKEIGDQANLIQLEDGFYKNIWLRVAKSIVQRWKVNETQTGTLLVFQCAEGAREAVERILRKYRIADGGGG